MGGTIGGIVGSAVPGNESIGPGPTSAFQVHQFYTIISGRL
ncbi:hypothetical protein LLB_3447 [Legionella longbeachae D-4968]|nr:hypothetical protein LLB_3447 [Legionella longbeachae D-4968]